MPEVSANPQPSVYGYLDFRMFLNDWLVAKQANTPGYTLSRFARKAACSYSHVRNVYAGERKLLPPQLEGFIAALKLSAEESEFFTLLVRYQQSPSLLERAQLLQIISGTLRFRDARPLEGEGFLCLARLSYAAVYELAFSPDFRPDAAWVATTLNLPESEAASALRDLLAVGMLVTDAENVVRPAHAVLKTAPELKEIAWVMYYENGLDAATAALDQPRPDQHFYAATAAVPSSLVDELRDRTEAFQRRTGTLLAELQSQASREGAENHTVYQVQVQLLPVTQVIPPESET